jgi:hypothetical protein
MGRIVSFVVLSVLNAAVMVLRLIDAVAARGGGAPRFSLMIPMWMQPETRVMELIALGAPHGISIFLPVVMLGVGVIDLVLRRKKEQSTTLSKVLVGAGGVCLVVNAVTAHLIFTARPSFG